MFETNNQSLYHYEKNSRFTEKNMMTPMCFRDTNDLIFPLSTWKHFLPVKPHVGHVHHANGAEEFPNAKQTEQDLHETHRCPGYPLVMTNSLLLKMAI